MQTKAPKPIERWVNVYRDGSTTRSVYSTEQLAKFFAGKADVCQVRLIEPEADFARRVCEANSVAIVEPDAETVYGGGPAEKVDTSLTASIERYVDERYPKGDPGLELMNDDHDRIIEAARKWEKVTKADWSNCGYLNHKTRELIQEFASQSSQSGEGE